MIRNRIYEKVNQLFRLEETCHRIIFTFTRGMPYSYMLDATNLSSLSSRRDDLSRIFYRATRIHSADYAVARYLSLCLSVRLSHAGIESKRLYISSKFFHHRVAPPF